MPVSVCDPPVGGAAFRTDRALTGELDHRPIEMATLLDDLFGLAIRQPAENTISVRLGLATNEITRDNLVSYAEGPLFYRPAHRAGIRRLAPRFASEPDGITQYFSNRKYTTGFPGAPFSSEAGQSDPLEVTIAASGVFSGRYSITLH